MLTIAGSRRKDSEKTKKLRLKCLPETQFLRIKNGFGAPAEQPQEEEMKLRFKLKLRWVGLRLVLSLTR